MGGNLRKRQDSNLRAAFTRPTVFEAASFNHSDTLPVYFPSASSNLPTPFSRGRSALRAHHQHNASASLFFARRLMTPGECGANLLNVSGINNKKIDYPQLALSSRPAYLPAAVPVRIFSSIPSPVKFTWHGQAGACKSLLTPVVYSAMATARRALWSSPPQQWPLQPECVYSGCCASTHLLINTISRENHLAQAGWRLPKPLNPLSLRDFPLSGGYGLRYRFGRHLRCFDFFQKSR